MDYGEISMKLKSIEIYGFKSFAEPIQLNFNQPVSIIVGPNGSGKSNISDAVWWVLGEQSGGGDELTGVLVTYQGAGEPVGQAGPGEAEPVLVGDPLLVDLGVVARQAAQHDTAAHIDADSLDRKSVV